MKVTKDIINILFHWHKVNDSEIIKVKKYLMPEDDVANISMVVTEHPNIDIHGKLYMEWCEINVYENNILLCHIIVDAKAEKATYSFEV